VRTLIYLAYLVSIVFFILGLKQLSSPRTARRGNLFSMIGMLVAVAITLLDKQIVRYTWIVAGVVVGGAVGVFAGRRVKMTAMPQMVALFNAFGGGASALVVRAEALRVPQPALTSAITLALGMLIGVVTFTGSIVAFAKLQGIMRSAPIVFRGQTVFNGFLLVVILAAAALFAAGFLGYRLQLLYGVLVLSALLGVTLVIPVGGADMPVIIALLNSYSGLAAAATGFAIGNYVLIVAGALVGASGIILTQLMCRAMNRSLGNVLFGAVGGEVTAGAAEKRTVIRYTATDAAAMLENAMSVIVIPGYGLAVAQGQYALQEAVELLRRRGTSVSYAIHPVAGRMPGHMNVLLAEANVPYELLKDMDEVNEEFASTDVVLVAGANDVINPAARDKGNPLSGMPILQADKAQTVIIVKRSLSPGFSGVDNPLFYESKTMMVFGDAKDVLTGVAAELKKGG
jgi:NAD(P) transhydrogenase subunit beta